MQEMTATTWQRRGSSIIFSSELLGSLINNAAMIDIREALSWMKNWPQAVPNNAQTVLVSGLEAVIEVMSQEDAEEFLRAKMKPFIHKFQSRWDSVGLVFGFGCGPGKFRLGTFEDLLFKCPGGVEVKLADSLWNGTARRDMCQIMVENKQTNKPEPGGYYVRRLS
jgi:hypothetical protein